MVWYVQGQHTQYIGKIECLHCSLQRVWGFFLFFFYLSKVGIDSSCQISRLWLPSAKDLPVLVTNQPFGLQSYLFKGKSFHLFNFGKKINTFGLL